MTEPADDLFSGWLTREQLAARLGVSVATLARWSTQQTGPDLIKIGRRAYYSENTVREWLKTRVVRKG